MKKKYKEIKERIVTTSETTCVREQLSFLETYRSSHAVKEKDVTVYIGDVNKALHLLPEGIVDCVITSPPYWKQRDYKNPQQIGQESSYLEYIKRLVDVFNEMKKVLKPTGTFFLNVGYKYQNKELLLIPELLAVELQKNGWTLLNKIIWCLEENTKLFVKRNNKYLHLPITAVSKDDKVFTQDRVGNIVLVEIKNAIDNGVRECLKITTKSGREIICSKEHRFPVKLSYFYGSFIKLHFKKAEDLTEKDHLWVNYSLSVALPNGDEEDYKKGFIVGFFIAEGSYIKRRVGVYKDNLLSKSAQKKWGRKDKAEIKFDGIQLSCGKEDIKRGYLDYFKDYKIQIKNYEENTTLVYSRDKQLLELIRKYVVGEYCNEKHLVQDGWNTSLNFIKGVVDGFLAGDGGYDKKNNRWRVSIKPNLELKDDLILACRLAGYEFRYEGIKENNYGTQTMTFIIKKELKRKTFRNLYTDQIDKIEEVGNKRVYDIEIEPIYTSYCGKGKTDVPTKEKKKAVWNNICFLANGIWTHNSKPNAMPSSLDSRFSNVYEPVFLFVKEESKYNYYLSLDKLRLPVSNFTNNKSPEDILNFDVENSLLKDSKSKGHVLKVFKSPKGDIFAQVAWENGKTTIEVVNDFDKESQLPVELVCQDCGKAIKHEIDINNHYGCKGFPKPILPPKPDFNERVELKPSMLFFSNDFLSGQTKKQLYKGKFKLSPENRGASPGARKSLFGEYLVLQRRYEIFQPIIAEYLRFWRGNRGITTKEIDELLGYRDTAGHWFRKDTGSWGRGGSIPLPDDWFKLKEILKFDDIYDRWVTETQLVLQTVRAHPKGKNPGDVWSIKLQPLPESHFATFPEELVKKCIEAGCPEGGIVLDPFAGSGTVGKVSYDLGRSVILIELVPEYLNIIKKRCENIREVIYVK